MRCDCIAPHRSSASTPAAPRAKAGAVLARQGCRSLCEGDVMTQLRLARSLVVLLVIFAASTAGTSCRHATLVADRRPEASDGRGHDFGAAADTGQRGAGRRSHRDGHQQRRWDAPPGDDQQHWRVHDQSATGPIPDRSRAALRGSREWRSYRPAGWRERHRLPAGDHGRARITGRRSAPGSRVRRCEGAATFAATRDTATPRVW